MDQQLEAFKNWIKKKHTLKSLSKNLREDVFIDVLTEQLKYYKKNNKKHYLGNFKDNIWEAFCPLDLNSQDFYDYLCGETILQRSNYQFENEHWENGGNRKIHIMGLNRIHPINVLDLLIHSPLKIESIIDFDFFGNPILPKASYLNIELKKSDKKFIIKFLFGGVRDYMVEEENEFYVIKEYTGASIFENPKNINQYKEKNPNLLNEIIDDSISTFTDVCFPWDNIKINQQVILNQLKQLTSGKDDWDSDLIDDYGFLDIYSLENEVKLTDLSPFSTYIEKSKKRISKMTDQENSIIQEYTEKNKFINATAKSFENIKLVPTWN